VAFAAFPFWLIAIAKKIIAYFPIFGWAVALGGTIFVQRSNHKKALDSLNAGQKSLQEKPRSVLLFPEGTRSDDGVVRPFKKGGLILAIQSGMPCVPVAICGTRRIVGRAVDRFEPIVACRWVFEEGPEMCRPIFCVDRGRGMSIAGTRQV
jgi:1-acyl-sn-glycerol-3-phosphate acyltransferase